MKPLLLLVCAFGLTACSSPRDGRNVRMYPGTDLNPPAAKAYEHQLVLETSDGATPFLQLVEAPSR